MRYRDFSHRAPEPGAELPAFIVSEYDDGDFLLYSHGGFDIWCVYHAVQLNGGAGRVNAADDAYPLRLDTIRIEEITGTQTDFKGSFLPSAVIEYESTPELYSFDAPEDTDYMQDVRNLAFKYGQDRVWNSFLTLYESIPQQRGIKIKRSMTETVKEIAAGYPEEAKLRFTLDCLLCAMIAENNRLRKYGSKYDTRLGKKVKALGVYQAIYETGMSIRQVADYSKYKGWRWISAECRKRGILTPDL